MGVQAVATGCSVVIVARCGAEEALMTPPHDLAAGDGPGESRRGGRRAAGWAVAVSCVPLLAGAVTLVAAHKAGVAFLILFAASTVLMAALMAAAGHGRPAGTTQQGLAKLRAHSRG